MSYRLWGDLILVSQHGYRTPKDQLVVVVLRTPYSGRSAGSTCTGGVEESQEALPSTLSALRGTLYMYISNPRAPGWFPRSPLPVKDGIWNHKALTSAWNDDRTMHRTYHVSQIIKAGITFMVIQALSQGKRALYRSS